MRELTGRTALITGATGGIGQAIARALHGRGATVKLSGRRADVLQQLAGELGSRAEVLPADLSSSKESRKLAQEAGDVDVFVANAGIPGTGRLPEYTEDQLDRVVAVNLRSPIQMTHAFLPRMLERDSGSLIYISSISGKVASPSASLYNATKFGLRGFALALHEDLRETGVGATVIFPGLIGDAGMWADSDLKAPSGAGVKSPEDVAEAVLRAIERNPREIDVAGLVERLGGWISGPSPSAVAAMQRAVGGEKLAAALADAQREKR